MSNLTPVLYGKRLYSKTLYSENFDRITTTFTFSEGINSVDSRINTINKVLTEGLTLADPVSRTINKHLAETLAISEFLTKSLTHTFQDILLVQDWISIRLIKPSIWTINVAKVPVSTLYGKVLFGRSMYSAIGGANIWNTQKPAQQGHGWKNFNQLESHS